jgi:transposase
LLRQALQLWRKQRAGPLAGYAAQVEEIEELLSYLLRPRRLRDRDNQRLLDGIGWQHDRGRVLRFLHNPAVIARKVSHCSKNERGAEAFAVFASLARTAVKQGEVSVTNAYLRLMHNATTTAPT